MSDNHGIYIIVNNNSIIAKAAASCPHCYKIFYSESKRDQHEKICPLNPDN